LLRINRSFAKRALRSALPVDYDPGSISLRTIRMAAENEPRHQHLASQETIADRNETLATSLTDLIDEMDRAAFLRSLSSRHLKRPLEIDLSELRARPKTS
jgi:hypothetical protein